MDKRLSNYNVSRGIQGIATDPNLHKRVKKKKTIFLQFYQFIFMKIYTLVWITKFEKKRRPTATVKYPSL
jgi:hypothetical protein